MAYPLLDRIDTPEDLRRFRESELKDLAPELRRFIIDIISEKEGHLGASLGVVELTIALHYVFQTPRDLLVWDVGHQAYGHKILTGRKNVFHTNRDLGGISGFPKRRESVYDTFGVGHSSTSISAALGMAMATALKNDSRKHIAVIGDASIASGMAFEALNHAGVSNADLLVVLNDNAIGIDPSVGALKQYLTRTKSGNETGQENLFEALNFDYYGPIDGHDLDKLIHELERQKNLKGPRLLHVRTTKGKGLQQAEQDQVKYHAPGRFDKITGELPPKNGDKLPPKYQEVFGETILELAKVNEKIVGITPAMPTGSSLKIMMEAMPDRAFDVGIAEQHAVTLAAGMVTQGLVPFCTIYSTFLQRAYDQVIHDVALQKLPVIFCLDRAGLVGKDGATHHGVFDLAYLNLIPDLIIAAPMDAVELRNLMFTASQGLDLPIAMRYPRGRCNILDWKMPFQQIPIGESRFLSKGSKVALISIGTIGSMVQDLIESEKLSITHLDARFLKPFDVKVLKQIFSSHDHIVTIEDGTEIGGLGDTVLGLASQLSYQGSIHKIGIPDQFIEHGSTADLHKMAGIDRESLLIKIKSLI
ncbi:1-deoxy-D-xylulose-5-phosphate synthase [Nonlabens spongiae]|uniref:1-deoxy-D-xylulose-5-phosphate synthase n=1 Tax=Nonlabens spongiae TaxID=331648 RepID=A0A1W6MKV3_9FLAO|nr:1-deoxy-D-xylulose-5-phosphate synthase [Nonlabens spongiae]ARN78213.1 1-deoxy-D-xylulose-5-phosphate synthase [Nonlabens spongiae]